MKLLKISLLFLTTLTLIACGSSGGGSSAGGSAAPKPKISIADATGEEGGMINFKFTTDRIIGSPLGFYYQIYFDDSANSANETDFEGKMTGNKTIAPNNSSATISIPIKDDILKEHSETFMIMLSNLATTDATFTDHTAIGTILVNDEDGIVKISVADAKASEDSGEINFKVTSNFTHPQDIIFNYRVFSDNNSVDEDDFSSLESLGGKATIDVGDSSTTISIKIATDDIIEPDEIFRLLLVSLSANATVDSSANISAKGTIINDDLGEISNQTAMIGDGQITLSWTNPNSNIFAGVVIAQATGMALPNSCSEATIMLDSSKNNHIIMDLTNGTAYSFRICAKSNDGNLSGGVKLENLISGDIDGDGIISSMDIDDDGDGLIEITTATEFNNIRHNLDATSYKTSGAGSGDATGCPTSGCNGYELTANIDLSSFTNWSPIGRSDNRFTATFNGNNNTISNLTVNRPADEYVSLFGVIEGVTVSNLKLTNVRIYGRGIVGALAGWATGAATLSNIELIGDDSQASDDAEIRIIESRAGGLVGVFDSGGTIINSSSSLTIRGEGMGENSRHIGGLVGEFNNITSKIVNSSSSGAIFIVENGCCVGGLVGVGRGSISQSWASGNISSNGGGLGGLVGISNSKISNSWASSNISGNNIVGGLVGEQQEVGSISQSWASGNVSGTSNVGGLVGDYKGGNINGRNYQLDASTGNNVTLANDGGSGDSFVLDSTSDLANLSGATSEGTSDWGTNSGWHAGFDISDPTNDVIDFKTRFCDTNKNGRIDPTERVASNSVWVMEPTANNVTTASTDIAGVEQGYYQIPALRCIGDTKGKTPTQINNIRKANIDRQRRLFAK